MNKDVRQLRKEKYRPQQEVVPIRTVEAALKLINEVRKDMEAGSPPRSYNGWATVEALEALEALLSETREVL